MLVAAASHHSRGVLPLVLKRTATTSSPLTATVTKISLLPAIPHPVIILTILSLFGIESLIDAAPTIIYYTSLFVMILTTCQVLTKKWEFNQFKQ